MLSQLRSIQSFFKSFFNCSGETSMYFLQTCTWWWKSKDVIFFEGCGWVGDVPSGQARLEVQIW